MSKIRNPILYKSIFSLLQPDGRGRKSIRKRTGTDTRIAFYCSSDSYSEIEINILRLIVWLNERGLKILVFASAASPFANAAKERNIEIVNIETNIRYFDFKHARKMARLLRKRKIKLLFIGTTRDIDLGSLIKGFFFRKLKLIYLQHVQLEVPKRDFFHTLRYRQYDAWVISLPYLSNQIKIQTHYNIKKIHVIPFCLDIKSIQQNQLSQLEARHRLDLPPASKIIGVYGHIGPQKKQDLVIRTARYLKTRKYDLDVLIMGTPVTEEGKEYYNLLVKMIKEFKLSDKIHFRPFIADENLFYNALDIFAVITDDEASGMQTIKALANGIPVIAVDIGGNKEILENENLGLLYRPDDFDDFASKVIRLMTQDETRIHLKKEGMITALQKFDKSLECDRMEELINQLIK